eukprot:g4000.t1
MASSIASVRPTRRRPKRKANTVPALSIRNVEEVIELDVSATKRRRRRGLRNRETIGEFSYVNWMDDDFVRSGAGNATTWSEFVSSIGDNLKAFPIREQEKNDCAVCAAVTAFEVQNRAKFTKNISSLGGFRKTKDEGAHLNDQIPRVWGATNPNQPQDMLKYRKVLNLGDLVEQVKQGPVYIGVQELGYPWANRATADKYGKKERFIVPRFDPYNNPWDYKRRSGADGHAIVVIGMLHSKDKIQDGVVGGYPERNRRTFGNCFVTKCTTVPCGWGYRPPWTKKIKGVEYSREEISYALLPIDLFSETIRKGNSERRLINDAYAMKMTSGGDVI